MENSDRYKKNYQKSTGRNGSLLADKYNLGLFQGNKSSTRTQYI